MIIDRDTNLVQDCAQDVQIVNGAVLNVLGTVKGDLYVSEGCVLNLLGTAAGNLGVAAGGVAKIAGVLNAQSIHNEGQLSISGVVNCDHELGELMGKLTVADGALINGKNR